MFESIKYIYIDSRITYNMNPLIGILGNPSQFLQKVFSVLQKDKIDVSAYELDHLCYRVETQEKYISLKKKLSEIGKLLTETIIGGRPISTFKLNIPFKFEKRSLDCIELPAPKEGYFFPEGYEHVEFVIKESFQEFMKKHPLINFDTRGIDNKINPDIFISYPGFTVKFHHHPLEYVITYLQ